MSKQTVRFLLQQENIMRKEKDIVTNKYDGVKSYVRLNDLKNIADTLDEKYVVPIGSVEFVREYARLKDIRIPTIETYPKVLESFMYRDVKLTTLDKANKDNFVKPITTKLFTGQIADDVQKAYKTLNLNAEEVKVYECPPVNFLAEYRFYVSYFYEHGYSSASRTGYWYKTPVILGSSSYDDQEEDFPPDMSAVNSMVETLGKCEYGSIALDVGVLPVVENGILQYKTALVEVNDAWSLGYYPWGDMKDTDYLFLIVDRWREIVNVNDKTKAKFLGDSGLDLPKAMTSIKRDGKGLVFHRYT